MSDAFGNPSVGEASQVAQYDILPSRNRSRSDKKLAKDLAYTGTVLIYRLGSLGDTLVSLPCFHKIAERFPNARRIVLTNHPVSSAAPRLFDILNGSGLVHGVIEYEIALRSPIVLARLWLQLRRIGAEQLCYLTAPRGRFNLLRDLTFFRACGIRRVIGAPVSSNLNHIHVDPENGEQEYECERLARCIAELGPLDLDLRSAWDLGLSDHEREEAARVLEPLGQRRFIAVNMGGKAVENDWGEANWRELFEIMLRDRTDLEIAVVGGSSDDVRTRAIAEAQRKPILNLCGRLSPRVTAAVLSRASLFIGHDSGPVHLAGACGVPCVGIFSNKHQPHTWHPYGKSHRIIHPTGPITTVSVARVSEVVLGAIQSAMPAKSRDSAGPSLVLP